MAERCRASASSWDRFRIPSSKAYSPGLAKHTASINADMAAPMPRPLSRVANGARHQNDATATSVKEANQVADNASAMRPKALASTGCATTPSTPKSAPAPLKRDLIDKKSEHQTRLFLELLLNKRHPQHAFFLEHHKSCSFGTDLISSIDKPHIMLLAHWFFNDLTSMGQISPQPPHTPYNNFGRQVAFNM